MVRHQLDVFGDHRKSYAEGLGKTRCPMEGFRLGLRTGGERRAGLSRRGQARWIISGRRVVGLTGSEES